MIRIRRGTALLNKVVAQFDKAVADLDAAVEHIEASQSKQITKISQQHQKHNEALDKLHAKEEELYGAGVRARTVRANIAKLVGSA